mmetsp:Transcript_15211/g.45879  ORF Transcript_15211/g.45879 Transcript_15211/m.45879 type:complete len:232 (-) Transcript_15211:49-744(-)
MRKPTLRQKVVRLDRALQVALVDADGHPHQHVLRSLHHLPVDTQQVRPLQGLEAKVVVVEITVVNNLAVQPGCILAYDFVNVLRDQRRRLLILRVHVVVHELHRLAEGLQRALVQVGYCDASRQECIVRVCRSHGGGGLRSELIQLRGGDAFVDSHRHLLSDQHRVAELGRQPVAELCDPRGNLVKVNLLLATIPLDHKHLGHICDVTTPVLICTVAMRPPPPVPRHLNPH